MPKRISKRVREEAAMLCAIAASADGKSHWPLSWVLLEISGSRAYTPAAYLAVDAWCVAFDKRVPRDKSAFDIRYAPEIYAEAESLIRCGWSPGDGGGNG